jgi:DNA primase
MAIPQSFIQELIARADVVEIVGRHVQLKKGGANFMGLCPFHGEKSPSFSVSPAKQFYHCFGCGKNGNAISFLMEHVGMTFVEAVKDLAQQYGLQVPDDDTTPADRARLAAQREKQDTLNDVLEKAVEAYRKQLKNTPQAVDYLKGRGLSGEVAKTFCLGYAPPGWRSLASVFASYDDPLLVECGLVIANTEDDGGEEKRYDRFRDRIMFPIRNVKGQCIGFGARVLGEGTPKYLNSPETPVFSKGRELYGLFEARHAIREQGYVLVTEGYMDVVALAQLGFPNAVATLGTACTPEHVQKLFRFTDSVVFGFDGDAAGLRAARKALEGALPYATDVRSIKFLFLPKEHDPDSYIRTFGKEAFSNAVSQAVPLSRLLVDVAREGCDVSTAEGRAHMASNARPLWTLLPEGALKRQLLSELAEKIELNARELLEVWMPSSTPASSGKPARYKNYSNTSISNNGYSPYFTKSYGRSTRLNTRSLPSSRADHAVRLLFENMAQWHSLSHDEQSLLGDLPEPHGSLVKWLEKQLLEHGPQPWAALREGLREHPAEALALKLMQENNNNPEDQAIESEQELHDVLARMMVELLKLHETEAIEASKTDPTALHRYREIQLRRLEIEARTIKTN